MSSRGAAVLACALPGTAVAWPATGAAAGTPLALAGGVAPAAEGAVARPHLAHRHLHRAAPCRDHGDDAGGIDHLIYGWIFFALVIAGVLALSWRYFDRKVEDPFIDPRAIRADAILKRLAGRAVSPWAALGGVAVLAGVALGWAQAADSLRAPMPQQIFLPAVQGWQRVGYSPAAPWEPRAAGAEHRLLGSYRDGAGRRVEVFYALYAAQDEGAEAGGYGQGALPAGTDWNWIGPGADVAGTTTQRLRWQTS